MNSNQKLSLLFWLFKAKATKDGRAPLYVRVTTDRDNIEISLNRKIHPDFWDANLKRDLEGGAEAKKTNSKIEQAKVDLERHFLVLQSQFENVTPLMLKNVFNGVPATLSKTQVKEKHVNQKKLIETLDHFIIEFEKLVIKDIRSKETLKGWKSTRNRLREFLIFNYGNDDIDLKNIEYDFARDYVTFLTVDREEIMNESSAMKCVRLLKQLLTYAESKKWIDNNPIEKFRAPHREKEVAPLEYTDVMQIFDKEISVARLDEVRDAFIFQCFTGFAYQDVYNLSPENITSVGNKGKLWLIKDRGKTGVSEMVPILPVVASIIEKYKDDKFCIKHNRLIPVNSNQRYNGYLKEVADICGVQRHLTTHLARHTFADIMLNIGGVSLEDVSKMLGHRSIKTTMRYCRVRKVRIDASMELASNILFSKSGKFKTVAA